MGYNQIVIAPEDSSGKDYFYMPLQNVRISKNVVRVMQCTSDVPTLHDGYIFRYGGEKRKGIHGRFFDIWGHL